MDAQELRNLQEAYLEVVMNEGLGGRQSTPDEIRKDQNQTLKEENKKLMQHCVVLGQEQTEYHED